MTWEFKPEAIIDDKYLFKGPYYVTRAVNETYDQSEIGDAIRKILSSVEENKGLDRIQKLTHMTKGEVIWIIDNLSEEHKAEIEQHEENPEEFLKQSEGTTVLFPSDY